MLGPASAGITVRLDELDAVILARAGKFDEQLYYCTQHIKGKKVQKMTNRAITKIGFSAGLIVDFIEGWGGWAVEPWKPRVYLY